MLHLFKISEWAQYYDDADKSWETDFNQIIHYAKSVRHSVGDFSDINYLPIGRWLLWDIFIEGDFDKEFYVYCQTESIFLVFTNENGKYFVTDKSRKPENIIELPSLKFHYIVKELKSIKKKMEELEDKFKYRVKKQSLGKGKLRFLDRYHDVDFPAFDLESERSRELYKEKIANKHIGKTYLFQFLSDVHYAEGKKTTISQITDLTITDISFRIMHLAYTPKRRDTNLNYEFVEIECKSPFGHNATFTIDRNTNIEAVDLEESIPENKIVMLVKQKPDVFPYSQSFVISPADYRTIQMLKDLQEIFFYSKEEGGTETSTGD